MSEKVIEHAFFFVLLAAVTYLVWQLMLPFMPALVLSAIIATACYPLYKKIQRYVGAKRIALGSLLTTILVFLLVIVPLGLVGYLIFLEAHQQTYLLGLATEHIYNLSVQIIQSA